MKKSICFIGLFLLLFTSLYASKTTLLIVRHGETDGNKQKLMDGCSDRPLNEKGKMQARIVADKIKEAYPSLAAIYSSNLSRALQTASAVASKYDLTIHPSSALQECNFGVAEGMKISEYYAKYGQAIHALDVDYQVREERWDHVAIPEAETLNHLEQRIRETLLEICLAHPNQTVAVFSHGIAMRVFLAKIENYLMHTVNIPNCVIARVEFDSNCPLSPFKAVEIIDVLGDLP